jgi:hypothetical protein
LIVNLEAIKSYTMKCKNFDRLNIKYNTF